MARILQTKEDGVSKVTTLLYQASSIRAVNDEYENMKRCASIGHQETYSEVNENTYTYSEGVTKYTIERFSK